MGYNISLSIYIFAEEDRLFLVQLARGQYNVICTVKEEEARRVYSCREHFIATSVKNIQSI